MPTAREQAIAIKEFFDKRNTNCPVMEPPTTEQMIEKAEAELGTEMPTILKELYQLCGGYMDDSAVYLAPLFGDDGMVSTTLFIRNLVQDEERPINTMECLFFGSDGAGNDWGMRALSDDLFEILEFDAECGPESMSKGQDLIAFYLKYEKWWNEP